VAPRDLQGLPGGLLDQLENAIVSLDRDGIRAAIDQISEVNPSLGRALARLAEILAYTPILHALKACKREAW